MASIIENGRLWLDISKIDPHDPTTSIDLPNYRLADLDPGQWRHFRMDVKWSLALCAPINGALVAEERRRPVSFV
jgi:hypothetical protein